MFPGEQKCNFYDSLVQFVPGAGKHTESFINNRFEGTLCSNTSSYLLIILQ